MYHFIGIKGSGTSALAQVMKKLNYDVQGSDIEKHLFTQIGLDKLGIKILPFNKDNIKKGQTIIRGTTFNDDNEEVKRAKELNLTIYDYPEFLGKLTKEFKTIAVCGTHGKTTTTSIVSHVLKNTIGCNYLIGDATGDASFGNKYFVIEACEYQKHFLNYEPTYTIITNIELDHVDCYENIEEIIKTFDEFANKTKSKVIACGDDKNVRKLTCPNIIYYGFDENNDVVAKNISLTEKGSSFDCYINNKLFGRFTTNLYGKHNILNALSCIYLCQELGLSFEDINKYLQNFKGANRRFSEYVIGSNVIIDDYAHHPTEIKSVISAVKQKYPSKKLVAVFIPYTYSRVAKLYKEIAIELSKCSKVYVTEIEKAREKQEDFPYVSSDLILNLVKNSENISKKTINKLNKHKNSVIIFMGCKDPTFLIDSYRKE